MENVMSLKAKLMYNYGVCVTLSREVVFVTTSGYKRPVGALEELNLITQF